MLIGIAQDKYEETLDLSLLDDLFLVYHWAVNGIKMYSTCISSHFISISGSGSNSTRLSLLNSWRQCRFCIAWYNTYAKWLHGSTPISIQWITWQWISVYNSFCYDHIQSKHTTRFVSQTYLAAPHRVTEDITILRRDKAVTQAGHYPLTITGYLDSRIHPEWRLMQGIENVEWLECSSISFIHPSAIR